VDDQVLRAGDLADAGGGDIAVVTDEMLRTAVHAAPDGIIIVDDRGLIEFANPMAAQLFGYTIDEFVGLTIEVLLPDELRAAHVEHRTTYARQPRTRAMGSGLDLRGVRKSGEEFPVEIGLSPVRAGDRTHVIAVVRDVTERRAAAAELMRAHEQLALVDDRERIARDLHDTVIQRLFAVGLSLQGALAAVTDAMTADRLETAIDEIDGTIRDIRTAIFSLHSRRIPTTGIRDDVLATTREAARSLGFEPQVAFEGPIEAVTPDGVREHLVPTLREALSNVVKHAAATRVTVTLAITADELVLRVADDGVGIDEQLVHGGRGLGNITERALAVGGRCELRRATPGGTVVEWRAPLK
jgi:PAS domain S-box-containing protein